jgi:hypothetical protein
VDGTGSTCWPFAPPVSVHAAIKRQIDLLRLAMGQQRPSRRMTRKPLSAQ